MGVQSSTTTGDLVVLTISGMMCGGCANAVTRALSGVPGVVKAQVDPASGCATVAGTARTDDLIRAVEAAGFSAELPLTDESRAAHHGCP